MSRQIDPDWYRDKTRPEAMLAFSQTAESVDPPLPPCY
jgi:hypothetical protein